MELEFSQRILEKHSRYKISLKSV